MTHRRKCLHNTCCAQYRLTSSRKTCTNAADLQQFRTGPPEKHRHSVLGYLPPEEYEAAYNAQTQESQPATPQP